MATRKSNKSLWVMLALIVIILLVILLLPGCGNRNAGQRAGEDTTALVRVGDKAPDFTVEMFDGAEISLEALRGKVVLLNFWATWCPPCREELTHVQKEIIDRFEGRPFVFLPVSRGESREAVAAFFNRRGYQVEVHALGVGDAWVEHGTPAQLYALCGYDEEAILRALLGR